MPPLYSQPIIAKNQARINFYIVCSTNNISDILFFREAIIITLTEFAHLVSGVDNSNESKAIVSLHDVSASSETMRVKTTTMDAIVKFWGFGNDKNKTIISLDFQSFDDPDYKSFKMMVNAHLANDTNTPRHLKLYILDKETTQHAIVATVKNTIIPKEIAMITFELARNNIKYKHMK